MYRRLLPEYPPMHRRIFGDASVMLPRRFPKGSSIHCVWVFSWDHTFDIGTHRHQNTSFSSPVHRQIFWHSWDRSISKQIWVIFTHPKLWVAYRDTTSHREIDLRGGGFNPFTANHDYSSRFLICFYQQIGSLFLGKKFVFKHHASSGWKLRCWANISTASCQCPVLSGI